MTKHKLLLALSLSIILPTTLCAQSSRYDPQGARELYTMARNILSPIELNNLDLTDSPADPDQTQFQLRRACLYLEAATLLDPTNPLLWRDLTDLYLSNAINDPNRAEIAVSNYALQNPRDNLPVNSLLDYYLSSFNDLDSRQAYLLEYVNVPYKNNFIQNYPHIYSQILTQLGKYAQEQGLDDDSPTLTDTVSDPNHLYKLGARTWFTNAYAISPYNDQALALLLNLPPQEVTDPNIVAAYEHNQALRYDNDLRMAQALEIAVQFKFQMEDSDIINYGDPIMARLQLINISRNNNLDTELILGPGNFIDPQVVITAEVNSEKPIVLAYRYLLQYPVLLPGESNSTTEPLNISTLRNILQNHPQQEFTITFRAYLDPVFDENNNITGRITSIQPAPVTVIRKAFIPTSNRLKAKINIAKNGAAQERIKATRLLAALVHEAELARRNQLSYGVTAIYNVSELQKVILQNLNHVDPLVRGWTVYA
ncbi:MAG: hypothetical protein GY869_03315, partial [Planctomycetes bacterium]|nr:hypothetical protein [Planctomycetota bacterium]